MKKKILLGLSFILLFCMVGCDNLMNTPTKKVEEFLSKYHDTDSAVLNQLDYVLDSEYSLDNNQRDSYKTIMKRQYQNITYTIKDEVVDGDSATVIVEIEVYDYNKTIREADIYLLSNQEEFLDEERVVNVSKFMDYKLEQMKKTTERVKYTLDFSLVKKDKEWTLEDISEIDRQKIHGIYNY